MEKSKYIWMDGKLINWDDANVHVLSHGLHYGTSVFEGVRAYEGEGGTFIFRLKEHTKRLFDSAKIINMEIPFSQDEINKATIETVKENNLKSCYIRPIAFIGDGFMGILPKGNPINVVIAVWSWGSYLGEEGLEKGIRIKVSTFNRHHVNAAMTKAKVGGHYVNSVLAKKEAIRDGYDEALLLDTEGYVSEGSGENIFIVRNGKIKTTPLTSVLDGITRDTIITVAKDEGLEVIEERFTRDELYTADEAFFTGTAAELTPIREVDAIKIGNGSRGEITEKLQKIYFDVLKNKNEKYKDWLTKV